MDKFFRSIIKHRKLVLIITVIALVFSTIQLLGTELNSDIASYLPDDSSSRKTITLLSDEFGINGDAVICIKGGEEAYDEVSQIASDLDNLDEVEEILWLGTYGDAIKFENGKPVSSNEMISNENIDELTGTLYVEHDGENYYIINVSLTAANATDEAGEALELIEDIVSKYDGEYYIGGNAVQSNDMLKSALGELPMFMLVGFGVILLILLLTSKSLMSAVIFLLTIGISIVFNLGTNFFTPNISTITFSVAAILQLALSMDYSIFLTHSYDELRNTYDNETALVKAIEKTLVVIAASALTTVAGFAALFAMKFELGFDLGLCLGKGVTFSFLSVIIIQPCLMLIFQKACDKTSHKALNLQFKGVSKLPKKLRVAAPIIAAILAVPALYFATHVTYYYLDSGYDPNAEGPKAALQDTGNQCAIIVDAGEPSQQFELAKKLRKIDGVTEVTGYYALLDTMTRNMTIPVYSNPEDANKENLLFEVKLTPEQIIAMIEGDSEDVQEDIEDIAFEAITKKVSEDLPYIMQQRIGAESARLGRPLTQAEQTYIVEQAANELAAGYQGVVEEQLTGLQTGFESVTSSFDEYKDKFFAEIDGDEYTFLTIKISGEPEGAQAKKSVSEINSTVKEVLGDDNQLITGNTSTVVDLEKTTETDFIIISVVSALLILIILIVAFKSLVTPIILVAVIQLAILINMALSPITGQPLNFVTYIIISAIQLGSTIDYAILMTKNYRLELENHGRIIAAQKAVRDSGFPITVSVSILCGACLSVYFISTDTIIREITLLIARGAFISGLMVLFILPAILTFTGRKLRGLQEPEIEITAEKENN